MPISGLVVSLAEGAPGAAAVSEIASRPEIDLGVRTPRKLAVVTETPSCAEDRRLWQWLWRLPGVVHVDVTFIALDDPPQEAAALPTHGSSQTEVVS